MIKNNEKQLESVSENIGRLKAYRDELSKILSPEKEVFWNALKSIAKKYIDGHKDKIMKILCERDVMDPMNGYLECKHLAGCILAYEEILNLAEKNAEKVDEASSHIVDLEKRYQEIKNNIEPQ